MSESSPSNEQNTRVDAKTRVDSAHTTPGSDIPLSPDPPLELLRAIAGQDEKQAEFQLRGQALELAGILQEKQRMLDERESDLNAKTAQIENELRHTRLARHQKTPLDAGIDLTANEAEAESDAASLEVVKDLQRETVKRWRDMLKLAEHASTPLEQPADDAPAIESVPETETAPADAIEARPTVEVVEHDEPLFTAVVPPREEVVDPTPEPEQSPAKMVDVETVATVVGPQAELETVVVSLQTPTDNAPQPDVKPQPHILRMPAAEDVSESKTNKQEWEQQRQALLQRKDKLDSRQQHVERMHEQVTSLHREALELQLSTEQLWSELMESFPSEELARRLSHTRNRLAEHFRLTSENLASRTDELHQLRQDLSEQENKLRQKRREIQMWADRRYDEIEMRTAELICRERELDRLEMEFDRQSIQWQQQRQAYRQEIDRLSGQLQG